MSASLIVGADSRLGSAILDANPSFRHTSRRDHDHVDIFLDLSNPTSAIFDRGYFQIVYLVAAVTKVVECEAEPQRTWRINADAPAFLALQANQREIFPVFVSSDAVERAPNCLYSRQKAYVEQIVLSIGGAVLRPSMIPATRFGDVANALVEIGKTRHRGLHRWNA